MKIKIVLIMFITVFAGNLFCLENCSKYYKEMYNQDTLMSRFPSGIERIKKKNELVNSDSLFLLCSELQLWGGSKWDSSGRAVYYYDSTGMEIIILGQEYNHADWFDRAIYSTKYNISENRVLFLTEKLNINAEMRSYKKDEYSYNDKEELIEWKWSRNINFDYDTVDWRRGRMRSYKYDSKGRLKQYNSKSWDWEGSNLESNSVISFKYDSIGRNIEELLQDSILTYLINDSRTLYSYDDNDSLIEGLHQLWNHEFFENTTRHIYFYNNFSLLKEHSWQKWNGEDWYNGWKIEYSYNNDKLLISESHLEWNYIDWDTRYMILYTHDSLNNIIQTIKKVGNDEKLINDERHDYDYDNFGNLTEDTKYGWNGSNWLELENKIYTYSELLEKPDTPINLEINTENNVFNLSWNECKYPNVEYKIYRKELSGDYSILVDKIKINNYTDKSIENDKEYFYYVSSYNAINKLESEKSNEVSAIISDVNSDYTIASSLFVYPLPVKDIINIKLEVKSTDNISLILFDLVGRKIRTIYDGRIDKGSWIYQIIPDLQSGGIYLIQCRTKNSIITKKILYMP
ncbi:T9SS type A sorting domain-containing protein [Bacteroidota bacterium]